MSEPENAAERTQELPKFPPRPAPPAGYQPAPGPQPYPVAPPVTGPQPYAAAQQGPGGLDQFFGPPGAAGPAGPPGPVGSPPTRRVPVPGPQPTPARNNKGLTLTLQLLGLAVVALLAGSLWVACSPTPRHPSAGTTPPSASPGAGKSATPQGAAFQSVDEKRDTDCAANSYGQVPGYFAQHPCVGLTRWLYTTTDAGGARVVTTLAKVQMPDAAAAAGLKALTDSDGTGSIGYLMHNGFAAPTAPDHFGKNSGYTSALQDTIVVIAESAYLESDRSDVPGLKQISARAIATEGK